MENGTVDIKNILNMDKLSEISRNMVIPEVQTEVVDPMVFEKKKRGRPKKDPNSTENSEPAFVPLCQSNDPYESSYGETNHMLRESIGQINVLSNDVHSEIDNIRSSKTIKGKYKYIADLCATANALVSTKISAIREMNSTTTNCHKLEIQRLKDIKAAAQQGQDDDKYMADLYNAYINTPINAGMNNPLLSMNSGNVINNQAIITGGSSVGNDDMGYQNYLSNLTPEQNRMILDGNPNIETVVVYDPSTGGKSFDVIDINTGIPVSNYPRPDSLILDDTVIDFASGTASNTNIGQNWKVVTLGDSINNY